MKTAHSQINDLSIIDSDNLTRFESIEELKKCLLHIEQILDASILLYKNNFFEQSVFLVITTLEEISKAEVCAFRYPNNTDRVKRSKDGLFNHHIKHSIAANEVTFNFLKIKEKYGVKKIQAIFEKLKNGSFINIRENSLYFRCNKGKLKTSDDFISQENNKILLELCIEIFEDRLFGYSDQTDFITDRVLQKLELI